MKSFSQDAKFEIRKEKTMSICLEPSPKLKLHSPSCIKNPRKNSKPKHTTNKEKKNAMVYTMVMVVLPQRSGEVGGDKVIHALFCVAPRSGLWWTWISWMLYPLLGLLIEWHLDWCGRVVCSSIRFPCPSTLLSLTPPLLLPRLVGRLSWWWRYIMVLSRLKGRLSWWWR